MSRPNSQYNTAKRESEEAEMIDSMQEQDVFVIEEESEQTICDHFDDPNRYGLGDRYDNE